MFTGIVQGLGEVLKAERLGKERRFRFLPLFSHSPWQAGESISINGVCLSVEKYDRETFSAYASAETLAHTNLGELNIGARVNLERALELGERLGGHLVSGHVDCVAIVESVAPKGESRAVRISFPAAYSSQVVDRGSVTLDGISLTITFCSRGSLAVNIIPDSLKRTNAVNWKTGTRLNMETDLIGKYVASFLEKHFPGPEQGNHASAGLDLNLLARNGFI